MPAQPLREQASFRRSERNEHASFLQAYARGQTEGDDECAAVAQTVLFDIFVPSSRTQPVLLTNGAKSVTSRASSELLLVGSYPADSTDTALRTAAAGFSDLVFALPDGETGLRARWVAHEYYTLISPNPAVETINVIPSGAKPRQEWEKPMFRIRPGVQDLHFVSWPRIDETIASYREFRALRHAGVIPAHLRFQVGLPFPFSAMHAFKENFAADYPVAERAYEDLVTREFARLLAEIPADELAIQWDVCYEVLDIERVLPWSGEGAWERFAGPVNRITRLIPEEVAVGYHLCYGTSPEWPMYEARDMELVVRMANYAVANSGRTVDWLHLAGPRTLRSED